MIMFFCPRQGYRLYFSTNNVTSMQPVSQNKSAMVETLTQLSECFVIVITTFPTFIIKQSKEVRLL